LPAETLEEDARAAFSFFAWRFSFSDLLAAVFEFFEPPLSLLAMASPSKSKDRDLNVPPLEPTAGAPNATPVARVAVFAYLDLGSSRPSASWKSGGWSGRLVTLWIRS
jgi:hypothetical protein